MPESRFPLARLVPLGLILLVADCAAPSNGAVIHGIVSRNGTGIAGATVRATLAARFDETRSTAQDGSYQFDGLVFVGTYTVSATAAGLDCVPPSTTAAVTDLDDIIPVDFACTPPPATIVVTVTSQGTPVSGASVTVTGPSQGSATTGSSGTVTFASRIPGSYTVSATRAGLACPNQTANPGPGATANVAIDCTPLPVTIVVTVQNGGAPVSGAIVTLSGPTPQNGTTAASGTVTFAGLIPGSYSVSAQQAGLQCGTGTANPAAGETANVPISCAPATGTIVVTVRNGSTGALIPGATVTLSGPTPGSGTTNANGQITFSNLNPGSYSIATTAAGFSCPGRNTNISGGATVGLFVDCTP